MSSVASPVRVERITQVHRGRRIFVFYSLAVLLTGAASLLFADLLWRVGWSASRSLLLFLFALLFMLAAVGCMHGIYGFIVRRFGDQRRITALGDYQNRSLDGVSTALVFPIYNEDVSRVFNGLRATFESLTQTGEIAHFDFFILSDSTRPDQWVEEERAWFDLAQTLGALGRIHYRRRLNNEGKKSGNIRDFLSSWGQRYRYFVVFDADSIMAGKTIVDLVKLMETHLTVALIQTAPSLVNARSAFGRMQQFANRLYGPLYTAALNYWVQDGGNYWGHNAIIRTEPFMRLCDLPQLPGRKPFGGHILSHDFVEAALLRKENWEVWFAWDLDGSYEEGPPAILENAQRDRRWCQGNLQHFMLLFARGLRGINRFHLTLGIFGYLAGPLWFLFMLTGTYLLWFRKETGLTDVVVSAFTPFIHLDARDHALLIYLLAMGVIFLPKLLSLLDLAFDPERRRAFGGLTRTALGALVETLFSTLHAPVQMLFHSKFVFATLLGTSVHWSTQQRTADGTSWGTALREHWTHTVLGIAWGAVTWWLEPDALWWFLPVLCGMVLPIPLSVFTSRESWGEAAHRHGLFVTPEETETPPELVRLHDLLSASAKVESASPALTGFAEAVLDPYVNAVHISLLRDKEHEPSGREALAAAGAGSATVERLGRRLLEKGPSALSSDEQLAILADANTLSWLHREVWMRSEDLSDWWISAIRRYSS